MALGQLLDSFFTEEWDRFRKGLAQLDPAQRELAMKARYQKALLPGESATISLPGWDDVIKLGPRYAPTAPERAEYYSALREQRAPRLSADAVASMAYSASVRERIRTSAQPGYAQAWGEILTAVDNVQDFFSSVSTLGRLSIWAGERAFNAFMPGLSAQLAAEAGRAAAREAGQLAFTSFERLLLDAVARGEPVAKFLLGDAAALTTARRAAVVAAEKAAFQIAFRSALLGLGSRLALRAVPIVGWAVLAADLLNTLNLLGMAAMAGYTLLCHGPQAALIAGVPVAVSKGAGKKNSWKSHLLSPYSRQGRATRAARSAGRLPGIGNLLELFQTTDNLFDYGITLGGLVGTVMETGFAAERFSRGEATTLNTSSLSGSYTDPARATQTAAGKQLFELGARFRQLMGPRLTGMDSAELMKNQAAATVLVTAPAVLRVQETFDDDTHLKALVAYAAALSTLAPVVRGTGWQAFAAELADVPIRPPGDPSPESLEWAAFYGYDLPAARGWWWEGRPAEATGAEYVKHHVPAIAEALRDWLTPRRNTVEGAFYGGMVNAVTEAVWLLLEEDPNYFRWELTTEARLLSSFVEAGRIINMTADPDKLWAMWQEAGKLLEATGATSLLAPDWDRLAAKYGVPIIRALPPDAPWPVEWEAFSFEPNDGPPPAGVVIPARPQPPYGDVFGSGSPV